MDRPRLWRLLTTLFFALALAGIVVLLLTDGLHRLRYTPLHQHAAAVPLILIGLSYLSLQLSMRRPRGEMVKGSLLAIAFVFWGCEQLLPPSPWVTLLDSLVITIFVVDLSFIILEHLRRKDHDQP